MEIWGLEKNQGQKVRFESHTQTHTHTHKMIHEAGGRNSLSTEEEKDRPKKMAES